MSTCRDSSDMCNMDSLHCSTIHPNRVLESTHIWRRDSDDDMCQIDDKDDVMVGEVNLNSSYMPDDLKVITLMPSCFQNFISSANHLYAILLPQSFNPMCEPTDDMRCQFHRSSETEQNGRNLDTSHQIDIHAGCSGTIGADEKDFSFPCGRSLSEDDDELTESKITAFLDEKVLLWLELTLSVFEVMDMCIIVKF